MKKLTALVVLVISAAGLAATIASFWCRLPEKQAPAPPVAAAPAPAADAEISQEKYRNIIAAIYFVPPVRDLIAKCMQNDQMITESEYAQIEAAFKAAIAEMRQNLQQQIEEQLRQHNPNET